MHVGDDVVLEIQHVLQCRVEGFPQTYLGLPLSVHKVDRYLSRWRSLLLSPGG
jgi:hypothetical protein